MTVDACYTLVSRDAIEYTPTLEQFKTEFERGNDEARKEAMKKLLVMTMNGDKMEENLVMFIFRFVLPSKDKILKKLFYKYLEVCEKYKKVDGVRTSTPKDEIIMICDGLKRDLGHPNEYIRGAVLRLLCKIKVPDLIEPLADSVSKCLDRQNQQARHAFVRKNAVFALGSIYESFPNLVPAAPEIIRDVLHEDEKNICGRNAFVVLSRIKKEYAIEYISKNVERVKDLDEQLQLAIIGFIYRDKANQSCVKLYIHCASELLYCDANSVQYDAANALRSLSSTAAIAKATAKCYIDLITKETDNNVILIILDRLRELAQKHSNLLHDYAIDLLYALKSPDLLVKRKGIEIALKMVTSKEANKLAIYLKEELIKISDEDHQSENKIEYQRLLMQSFHKCAINFPEVISEGIGSLMKLLGDENTLLAVDIVAFIRVAAEKNPDIRSVIIETLLSVFGTIRSGKVFRAALWILGEYCLDQDEIDKAWKKIDAVLGEIPLLASERRKVDPNAAIEDGRAERSDGTSSNTRILPDGTYQTDSTHTFRSNGDTDPDSKTPLRAEILKGDYILGSVLSTTLTKFVLRYSRLAQDPAEINSRKAKAMLIMTGILRLGESRLDVEYIDEDSYDRIMQNLRVVGLKPNTEIDDVYLKKTRDVFASHLKAQDKTVSSTTGVRPDKVLAFRQFPKSKYSDEDEYAQDLEYATGANDKKDTVSTLDRIHQLTGISDKVYAEAVVTTEKCDIHLKLLLINLSNTPLQNLSVELKTMNNTNTEIGQPPQTVNLDAHQYCYVERSLKMSAGETPTIVGNIVFDQNHSEQVVVLKDIQIEFTEYVVPSTCSETEFQSMWREFEWENKVNVQTNITDLREYLDHLMKISNLGCLTSEKHLDGDCGFLAANLYAKTIFYEDILANMSLEKKSDDQVVGHIRIRSKTQDIALGLGDTITAAQKKIAV